MAVKINKGQTMDQLPLTPLIDIVFNLLIFFLVATKFAEAERELDVMLPDASEARAVTEKPREMFINIDAQGRYYVSQQFRSLAELQDDLNRAYVDNPGRVSVVIRADKRCRWEYVVSAINACKKAHIRDIRPTTRDPRDSGG